MIGADPVKSDSTSRLLSARARAILSRYWTLSLVTLSATIILEYALPRTWALLGHMDLPWKSPLMEIAMIVSTFILCYYLAEPISIRPQRLIDSICYPPLWSSVVISLLLICIHEQWMHQLLHIEKYEWYEFGGVSRSWFVFATALVAVFCRRRKSVLASPLAADHRKTTHVIKVAKSKRWVDAGEQPIKNSSEDLFSHLEISSRIVKHVQSNERSIALIGSIGSGKSSILNLACESIMNELPDAIVVKSDIWRAKDAKSMPQLVIDDIVRTLSGIVDTTGIRDLPMTYARFTAADPSGFLRRILDARKRSDSLHQLDRLCAILDAVDRHLILIIDDIDRVYETFDVAHISRFLWAVREMDKCCSVIAVDPTRTDLDYHKLCDSIETVPSIPVQFAANTLGELYRIWTSAYDDIDPYIHRKNADKFELGSMHRVGVQAYFDQQMIHSVPLRMLATLLSTPRALKHVLHRIDDVWSELHGEIEIDDLIILSTLRHVAPSVYQFIVTNIKIARMTSDGLESGILQDFSTRWNEVVEREQSHHINAVRRLVDLLGVEQLRVPRARNPGADLCPQGIHLDGPPDYLSRIEFGQIRGDEVRDQSVLRDIEYARQGNCNLIAQRLVRSTELGDDYRPIWDRFHAPPKEDLIKIIDHVIDTLVEQYGPDINPVYPLLVTLGNKAQSRSVFDRDSDLEDWLASRASRCVCESLSLSCGLLRFCNLVRNRLEDSNYESHFVQIILRVIATRIRSYGQLEKALSIEYPTATLILLGHISDPSEVKETRLIPLLIQGAKSRDPKVILQLANLLAHNPPSLPTPTDMGSTDAMADARINRERLQLLFGGNESSVLRTLSLYSGSNARYVGVARAARQELESY